MPEKLISGDNHIDLTYCPPDLWSTQAPANGATRRRASRSATTACTGSSTARTRACGTASARASCKYQKGTFHHVDEMKDAGFEWDYQPRRQAAADHAGDCASPTSTATASHAEIIYGCLMINDLIDDADAARLGRRASTTTGSPTSPSAPIPNRVFPLAIIPNTDPEGGGGRGAALRQDGPAAAAISPSSAWASPL